MEKINKILKDPCDAFMSLGDRRVYFAPVDKRKKISEQTQEVTIKDVVLKIDELVEAVNELIEVRNGK